jgi:energy-converting hydrogenase Eha subunit G
MSALHFRLDRHAFFRGTQLPPRHRRNPLLRIAMGILGLGLLAVLVFLSVFVGAAMLAIGVLYRLLRKRPRAPARDPQVVEGEFRVVGRS